MIIRQTTTIVFEYPQDYLQEQEWCKTKEDRWIHKGTDTLGAVYENAISYSIGQPSNSGKPNNCEVKNYCDDCLYTDTCDDKAFFYACTSKATISKMEQVDKDINVRSKDEPQTERPTRCSECKVWRRCFKEKPPYNMIKSRCPLDEPQTDCAWR